LAATGLIEEVEVALVGDVTALEKSKGPLEMVAIPCIIRVKEGDVSSTRFPEGCVPRVARTTKGPVENSHRRVPALDLLHGAVGGSVVGK
jgi:hypothetical protein